jgi:hypothetical protein
MFTHMLSPSTFYEVKLFLTNFRIYGNQCELRDTTATITLVDPSDPNYTATLSGPEALAPLGFWESTLSNPFNWILGGTYGYSEKNRAVDLSLNMNITSQVNKHNEVNAGLEYTYYDIKKFENRDTPDRLDKWRWHVFPQNFVFWANDKIEFEGVVINLGLRGDLRIPDGWFNWRDDPWNPLFSGYLPADSNLIAPRYQPPKKLVLAPRVSVSHPISDKGKVFFNWGHYYQEQPFERLYTYYRRDALGQITYGDPELPFVKSVQYEVGFEQNIKNSIWVSLSGYFKDVKNLIMGHIAYRSIESELQTEPLFYTYGSNRYLSSQGLEAKIEKRSGRYWNSWFNYGILVYDRGVFGFTSFYEDSTHPSGLFDYSEENLKRPSESRFNLGTDFHTQDNFGPNLYGFSPLANIKLGFLLWWRQQPAFTYNPQNIPAPYAPRNNKRWIAHWGVNMNFRKAFNIKNFVKPVFYIEVYNLFNTRNMWRGSFNENEPALRAYIAELDKIGAKPGERGDLAEAAIGNNPSQPLPFNRSPYFLYLNPRQIWAGIRFEFR